MYGVYIKTKIFKGCIYFAYIIDFEKKNLVYRKDQVIVQCIKLMQRYN